jgi:hypothetical protein
MTRHPGEHARFLAAIPDVPETNELSFQLVSFSGIATHSIAAAIHNHRDQPRGHDSADRIEGFIKRK